MIQVDEIASFFSSLFAEMKFLLQFFRHHFLHRITIDKFYCRISESQRFPYFFRFLLRKMHHLHHRHRRYLQLEEILCVWFKCINVQETKIKIEKRKKRSERGEIKNTLVNFLSYLSMEYRTFQFVCL